MVYLSLFIWKRALYNLMKIPNSFISLFFRCATGFSIAIVLIKCLLGTRYCARHSAQVITRPFCSLTRWVLASFYRWKNWFSGKLRELSRVTLETGDLNSSFSGSHTLKKCCCIQKMILYVREVFRGGTFSVVAVSALHLVGEVPHSSRLQ